MAGQSQHIKNKRQQFSSGRELINAVKTRREEAQAFKALADDVENEINEELEQYDPELIDGVRVRWISQGIAARDETAFSHALKIAHRLRKAGQRQTQPLSMPTSTPITLHNNKEQQAETVKCHPCATAKPWHDAYVVMSPNPKPTQALALARQDELQAVNAKPLPPWGVKAD